MKDYEILLICIAAVCVVLFSISIIFSKPIRPINILKVDNQTTLLAREQIRKREEEKRLAEEKRQLEEKRKRNEEIWRILEETNRRKLAEAALLEGKDVCMNCYAIEPRRCYCGHCTNCYGCCSICDD